MADHQKKDQTTDSEDWLSQLRSHAGVVHDRYGLPSRKVEEWCYTSLKPIANTDFKPDPHHGRAIDAARIPAPMLTTDTEIEAARIVVANGVYRDDLSDTTMLPGSVTVTNLDDAIESTPEIVQQYFAQKFDNRDQVLFALNTRYFTDGVFIHVPEGVKVEHPIEILSFCDGDADHLTAVYPRHMIIAEEGSELTVLEHLTGQHGYLNNSAYDIHVADNAKLHHYRWQDEESENGHHISTTHMTVGENSYYDGFTLTTGGALSRNETHAKITGDHAECRVNGSYLLRGKQHADTTIVIHHDALNGVSNQMFRGILDDRSRGVFQGKIFVHEGAQKTDGYQLNNAILLSPQAEVDVKPELEIYADDVKCSHGATTGQIDKDQLFYLRARGLPETQARRILLTAFVAEALQEIESESIRALFQQLSEQWLEQQLS